MPYARKIFPQGGVGSTQGKFKMLILSEGYLASESNVFLGDCHKLIRELLKVSPFNVTKKNPYWLNVYTHFTASNNSGPAINTTPTANRTSYESSLDTTTDEFLINATLVSDMVDTIQIRNMDGVDFDLKDHSPKEDVPLFPSASLIVVLSPSTSGLGAANGGEMEYAPNTGEYYFIGVTQDKKWGQVIARSIGSILGLGPEFELAGTNFAVPSDMEGLLIQSNYPNLLYYKTTTSTVPKKSQYWYDLITATNKTTALTVNPHPGVATTPDRTLPTYPESASSIALWEGGFGYRSKVYRSSYDCLMRRRIGDTTLPVRDKKVPFCKVCNHHIENLIS